MEKIQKDLGERLQTSRTELSAIKGQIKGMNKKEAFFLCSLENNRVFFLLAETERGIKQLQSQLRSREQELILERNLRRQLEKQIDPDKIQQALINDYAKPYAYF